VSTASFVPPANAFSHRFSVPASDIDELGHASNVSWVRWVQDAATAHSLGVGLDFEQYVKLGVVWVVRRHDIEYLGAAFQGDDIEALTWVDSLRGATSLRRTLFRRGEAVVARAATTWVLLDLDTRRPKRVPAELLARYGFSP
jgi:acyl-CoA thioester hydrolase